MKKLPRISGRECVKALERLGFYRKRQEGSHIILRKDNPFAQIVGTEVPIEVEDYLKGFDIFRDKSHPL